MAVKPRAEFDRTQFTATQWDSPIDKAVALEQLARFVESGFSRTKFTRAVYNTLYQHMFGHIAHYDADGFYSEWFSTPSAQHAWVDYVTSRTSFHGSPTHTWCDAEKVFHSWLTSRYVNV